MTATLSGRRLIGRYLTSLAPLALVPILSCSGNVLPSQPPDAGATCQMTYTPPPPIDPTVPARLYDISSYLWTSLPGEFDTATQKGVPAGTIDRNNISVLYGNVLDDQRQPLDCVKISVLGHPELGTTQSRTEGRFDMAVNAGLPITLRYERPGYLPVQRTVTARAQDYVSIPDIVMLPMGSAATRIELATLSAPALVRSDVSQDARGERQALLMVRPGTRATLRMANTLTQDAPVLNLHIVEYTRGPNGPDAMPGTLPRASGYTYAIDIWPDEALQTQAVSVEFSQPLLSYVENFLNFEVGTVVPTGYYDQQQGQWVGGKNGLVIKLLSVDNGLAQLDVVGKGIPARADQLQALGIADDERRQLATAYRPGQSFWRVQLEHLTPWDYNWPYGPPPDAIYPRIAPRVDGSSGVCDRDPNSGIPLEMGLSIACDSMATRVQLPILGSPFNLIYRSDRAKGYYAASKIIAPLSGDYLSPSLKAIELTISIGGQTLGPRRFDRMTNPILTNLVFNDAQIWDGFDARGRSFNTPWPATVRVAYVYDGFYYPTRDATIQQWGRYPPYVDATFTTDKAASEVIRLYQDWTVTLGFRQPDGLGFAGLGLDQYHEYDPGQRMLYLGNGDQMSLDGQLALFTDKTAGSGKSGYSLGGASHTAVKADFNAPVAVAVGSAGDVYIADTGNHYLRTVSAGIVETLAGGTPGYASNPEPASGGHLDTQSSLVYGFDGNIYIADAGTNYVRFVKQTGMPQIYTIAGNGYDTDVTTVAHPMSQPLGKPKGLAMYQYKSPSGIDWQLLFIADAKNHRIRLLDFPIDPRSDVNFSVDDPARWNFTITIAAGSGSAGKSDGVAKSASLNTPAGLAVAQRHQWLFIADSGNHCIRRLNIADSDRSKWTLDTVAGTCGTSGSNKEQTKASMAQFKNPLALAVSADERYLYIADTNNHLIRRLNMLDASGAPTSDPSQWTVMTVAGDTEMKGFPNGCADPASHQAIDLALSYPSGIAVTQSNIYVADTNNHCVRRLFFNPSIGENEDSLVVRGPNGDRFVFEKSGTVNQRLRHAQTIDAASQLKYQFILDPATNLLAKVLDGTGKTQLEIKRDDMTHQPIYLAGGASAERTDVSVMGSDHFIEMLENKNYRWQFRYSDAANSRQTGTLIVTDKKAAADKTGTFTYDALGRLRNTTLPAGTYVLTPQ